MMLNLNYVKSKTGFDSQGKEKKNLHQILIPFLQFDFQEVGNF